jgi:trigger factor
MEVKIKKTFDKKLKKDFEIVLPKELIAQKIEDYIEKIKGNVSLNGFRKGQVPVAVIKEKYGKSIMADEVEKLIDETIKKIVKDNSIRLALQPKADVKKIEYNQDVSLVVSMEIFPEVPEIDLKKIKVVKREVALEQADIDEAVNKFARLYGTWDKQDQSYKAKLKDAVIIDYVGRVDKKEFEGGSAKGYQLELGSKSFIDDFEEQLVGKKSGDEVKVKVKFPKQYHASNLAGQHAEFEVKINEVLCLHSSEITDEFIKEKFGLQDKQTFMQEIRKDLERQNQEVTLDVFKTELFDFLNKKYDFDLPEGMVVKQVEVLWREVEEELKTNPQKFKNDKEKEKAREAKEEFAKRMIRCGIILSEICEKNKIELKKEDFDFQISKVLAKFPGQEQKVIEYYNNNPQALENIRGEAIESKAINYILALENIEKKKNNLKDFEKFYKKLQEENA